MDSWNKEEFRALRREIDLRITLQNVFLLALAVLFATLSLCQLTLPSKRFEIALIFCIFSGIISLFWIHSGARTLQIKTYLAEVLEPRMRQEGGWEQWHPRHRIAGVLGSRWFISTKGVLMGAQAAMLVEAWLLMPAAATSEWRAAILSALALLVTALLLGKPRMSPTRV